MEAAKPKKKGKKKKKEKTSWFLESQEPKEWRDSAEGINFVLDLKRSFERFNVYVSHLQATE